MKPKVGSRNPEFNPPAFVALGSNLGDSPQIILAAMARLRDIS
jgi:hypothetical protein